MALTQSQINFYTKALRELSMPLSARNILLDQLKNSDSTERSLLGSVISLLGRNPFFDGAYGISCSGDVTCFNHKFNMVNAGVNSLTIQTNNKIEQINMSLSQANNLINNQNEQLAASYIKIAALEDKVESLANQNQHLGNKNEQLWNLVCQSKVIDCGNIITGQVLNEEGEL